MQAQAENYRGNDEVATFGGGCFWCVEALFKMVKGVKQVEPGYADGHTQNPTYKEVCTGLTGHAEVVQVHFDPLVISYREILQLFFIAHDPTTVNRQGNDIGDQYRSVILFHSPEQKQTAIEVIRQLEAEGDFGDPIVTQVKTFVQFFVAENYHHDYFANNPNQPYCQGVISPKVAKFRQQYIKK